MYNLDRYAVRIHLKTDIEEGHSREELIRFCLENEQQYIAIGWSCVYERDGKLFENYAKYYEAVKVHVGKRGGRMNHVHNLFRDAMENDLFWTRDEKGFYWICRATGVAQSYYDWGLDIGAVFPVKAYRVGMEVPGQIKASFNRPRGRTAEQIQYDIITEYSKFIYNEMSGETFYKVNEIHSADFLENLPDFELEELVISYLQVEKDYYLLSNSIAFRSTTADVECELIPRNVGAARKAVVQVKGPKGSLKSSWYKKYVERGFDVYLHCPSQNYEDDLGDEHVIYITKEELLAFVKNKEAVISENITKYKNLFVSGK